MAESLRKGATDLAEFCRSFATHSQMENADSHRFAAVARGGSPPAGFLSRPDAFGVAGDLLSPLSEKGSPPPAKILFCRPSGDLPHRPMRVESRHVSRPAVSRPAVSRPSPARPTRLPRCRGARFSGAGTHSPLIKQRVPSHLGVLYKSFACNALRWDKCPILEVVPPAEVVPWLEVVPGAVVPIAARRWPQSEPDRF
jgi:hypothetical protein